jgi:antirestriction protein ArdC
MKPNSHDVFEIVTNLIIEQLEHNIIPWKQPWKNAGLPRNLVTRKPYRGINSLLLRIPNYAVNDFLTFKQVQNLGGRIKKGEKAHLVVYWLWPDQPSEPDNLPKKPPTLRYYFVFNVSQCISLPERSAPLPLPQQGVSLCKKILEGMPLPPEIRHLEPIAYYDQYFDIVNMPKLETFIDEAGYFATLFHELIHSTGHPSRLNRPELVAMSPFGSEDYSIEELTAEIGACYLLSMAGIAPRSFENNVAYIQAWLAKLKKDKRFIVHAAARAERAVDYILNVRHEDHTIVLPEIDKSYENE